MEAVAPVTIAEQESLPSLADLFLLASREAAASDARLYRAVDRSLSRIKAILAEAEQEGTI
jgi:hypothetical protein